jgi:hypothetical protein
MPLTVIHHFADYQPGDAISDPATIEAILKSENSVKVVRTPEATKEPKDSFSVRK